MYFVNNMDGDVDSRMDKLVDVSETLMPIAWNRISEAEVSVHSYFNVFLNTSTASR